MPDEYEGFTIPVATDVADGPKAFREYTDDLDDRLDALDAAVATGGNFRVFTDSAALQAWAAPLGARANLIVMQGARPIVVPYTRAGGIANAPTWFPHLSGVWVGSPSGTSGRVNYVVPWPIDPPDLGGTVTWVMLHASNGIPVRIDPNEFDAQGFRWQVVSGTTGVPVLSWEVGIYESFD
jgi:hypothetical protein